MNDKKFEHLIQSKLKDHEANVPAGLWSAIEKELPRKKVLSIPVFFRYAAVAAVILLCSATAFLFLNQPVTETRTISQSINVPENVSTTNNRISQNIQKNISPESEKPTRTHIVPKQKKKENNNKGKIISPFAETKQTITEDKPETMPSTDLLSISEKKETAKQENKFPENVSQKEYDRKLKEFENEGKKDPTAENSSKKNADPGFSIGLLASNALPGSKNTNNRSLTRASSIMGDELSLFSTPEPLKFTHKMPISVGLTVEKRFGKHWGIESGVVYTLLRSDYKTQSLSQEGKQELHYIGIPLQAIYRFAHAGNFSFYTAAGPKIDFNINGRRIETARNSKASSNGTENIRDKTPQWSLQLRAGASYAFIPQLELYAEPSIAYFIDNKGDIPDLWKDKPLNFVLQVGLRTNF